MPRRAERPGSPKKPEGTPSRETNAPRGTLLFRLSDPRSLRVALRRLRRRAEKLKPPEESIAAFEAHRNANLKALSHQVRAGSFRFTALRPVAIVKSPGKYRPILIPPVVDRVLQRALLTAIEPYVATKIDFPTSHAFRAGKDFGVKSALATLLRHIRGGKTHVLIVDIKDFFPSVNATRLFNDLAALLPDRTVIPLLQQLQNWEINDLGRLPIHKRRCFPHPGTGLPQGSVLSPMLANFYVRALDEEATEARLAIVRYADDIAIAASSKEEAINAFGWLEDRLAALDLKVHPLGTDKSRICTVARPGFDYLGLHILASGPRITVKPARKSIDNAKNTISECLSPASPAPLAERYQALRYFVTGWFSAYSPLCDVSRSRAEILEHCHNRLAGLLASYGLLPKSGALSKSQRRLLGVETLFA